MLSSRRIPGKNNPGSGRIELVMGEIRFAARNDFYGPMVETMFCSRSCWISAIHDMEQVLSNIWHGFLCTDGFSSKTVLFLVGRGSQTGPRQRGFGRGGWFWPLLDVYKGLPKNWWYRIDQVWNRVRQYHGAWGGGRGRGGTET